jgi:ankyrin repeat protein
MSEEEMMAAMSGMGMGGAPGGGMGSMFAAMGGGGAPQKKKKSRVKFKKPAEKPLHAAAKKGDVEALRSILAAKSFSQTEIDERDTRGFSALTWACRVGELEAVKILLEAGASINGCAEVDEDAVAPLLAAAAAGHADVVSLLLDRGAPRDVIDAILEHTALHRAIDGGSKCRAVVEELLNRPDCKAAMLNAQDSSGFTPLCVAAATGNLEYCEVLLAAGASTTFVAEKGDTVLSVACKHKQPEIVKRLLSSDTGASLDPKAVYEAFKSDDEAVLAAIQDAGALTSVVPEGAFLSVGQNHNKLIGMNAVHFAAEAGDVETLPVLISSGISGSVASRFPTDEDIASSAAHFAESDKAAEKEIIRENVAKIQAVDGMSVGALKKSIRASGLSLTGCVEKVDLQNRAKEGIQREIDEETRKRKSRKKKQAARVQRDRQLQGGLTPLHVAAMKGHTEFCQKLVKVSSGVDVNAQDCNGNTPLHLAGFSGNKDVWEFLQSIGAKQRVTNKMGDMPEMAKEVPGCCVM